MTVRNIEPSTYHFLIQQSEELSRDGQKVSVNQLVGSILNQHYRNHLLQEDFSVIQESNQRIDYLTTAIVNLTETYQELIDLPPKRRDSL